MKKKVGPAEALRDFVLPALEVLTEPEEITSIQVEQNQHGELTATVVFADEPLVTQIWIPAADPADTFQGLGKFASDLQDHIAESRYAWGTLRSYPAEWDM